MAGGITVFDRPLLAACRASWRFYKNANFTVAADGLRIRILDAIGLRNVEFHDPTFQTVIRVAFALKAEGCAIDVGANIGRFLLNLVHFNRDIRYVGFEPLPIAAGYVRRLILDNNLKNHDVLGIGLSDSCGSALLHFGSEYDVSATLVPGMRGSSFYHDRQMIAVSTGDTQFDTTTPVSLVKIDCEGAELQVLRGMANTIRAQRPVILFEVMRFQHLLDRAPESAGSEQQTIGHERRSNALALEGFLRDHEYEICLCEHNGTFRRTESLDPGAGVGPDMNFLAVPRESQVRFDQTAGGFQRRNVQEG